MCKLNNFLVYVLCIEQWKRLRKNCIGFQIQSFCGQHLWYQYPGIQKGRWQTSSIAQDRPPLEEGWVSTCPAYQSLQGTKYCPYIWIIVKNDSKIFSVARSGTISQCSLGASYTLEPALRQNLWPVIQMRTKVWPSLAAWQETVVLLPDL